MKNQTQIEKETKAPQVMTPGENDLFRMRDKVDDAIHHAAAMLEALAALVKLTENAEHLLMSDSAVDGLQSIAEKLGADVRDRFEEYCNLQRRLAA